jgi:CheY-like chemotaxis protein
MTASMRPEDVKKAFDLGANSYLVKPINIEDLVTMVACLQQWTRINHFPPQNRMVAEA